MKNPIPLVAAAAVGALLMYYLDGRSGARRRAVTRDKLLAAGHDASHFAEAQGRRALDRLKGVAATRSLDRVTRRPPGTDEQLHERIRARIGHVMDHPRAVEVEVEHGHVCLRGHVLTREHDRLVREVKGMAGVQSVRDELGRHEDEQSLNRALSRNQAAAQSAPVQDSAPGTPWH